MTTTVLPDAVARFRETVTATLPGCGEATFYGSGDTLVEVDVTFPRPADWRTLPDGSVLPAGRLERALEDLGWSVETGLTGAIRDDVTRVAFTAPDPGAPAGVRDLWRAAQQVWQVVGPEPAGASPAPDADASTDAEPWTVALAS